MRNMRLSALIKELTPNEKQDFEDIERKIKFKDRKVIKFLNEIISKIKS